VEWAQTETEITARPGEIVIAPAGAPHRFANTGAGELRLTAIHPATEMTTEWLRSPLAENRGELK
jgi:mannose-6-phosphate isomerase-like protein (cupin superfamily)